MASVFIECVSEGLVGGVGRVGGEGRVSMGKLGREVCVTGGLEDA